MKFTLHQTLWGHMAHEVSMRILHYHLPVALHPHLSFFLSGSSPGLFGSASFSVCPAEVVPVPIHPSTYSSHLHLLFMTHGKRCLTGQALSKKISLMCLSHLCLEDVRFTCRLCLLPTYTAILKDACSTCSTTLLAGSSGLAFRASKFSGKL